MIPDLFLLGGLDLVSGLLLLSMKAGEFTVIAAKISPETALLLAIAMIAKGIYTVAWGFIGR